MQDTADVTAQVKESNPKFGDRVLRYPAIIMGQFFCCCKKAKSDLSFWFIIPGSS